MKTKILIPVEFVFNAAPLRAASRDQKVSNIQLAKERGCTDVHISRALNGKPPVSVDLIRWLCRRLGVDEKMVIQSNPDAEKNLASV